VSEDSGIPLLLDEKTVFSWYRKRRNSVQQWLTNEMKDECVEPHKAMPAISRIASQAGAGYEKGIAAK
jgi:hypothetical protein